MSGSIRQVGRVVQQSIFGAGGNIPHPTQKGAGLGQHLSFTNLGAASVKPASAQQVMQQTLNTNSPLAQVGLIPQKLP
jgi:hypothetical protein